MTAILLLLVLVPLAVLAVRCAIMIARLLGAEREAPSHTGGRAARPEARVTSDATAADLSGDGAAATETPGKDSAASVDPSEERGAVKVAPDASRVCVVCGERVLATARMCRHCGAALSS